MTVATLRKYLQPAPTLRWHPWAPLLALLFALIAVFAIGTRIGYAYAMQRMQHSPGWEGFLAKIRLQEQVDRPAMAALREVWNLDRSVIDWDRRDAPARDGWMRAAAVIDKQINMPVAEDKMRAAMVAIAEFRLTEFAPGSARWHADADWCRVTHAPLGSPEGGYGELAAAYSRLLGRPVTARQLAPAIPGGECK